MTIKELILVAGGAWLVLINLIAAILVIVDKLRSKTKKGSKKRIREKTFVMVSALGGCFFTFGTMLLIRHKTKSHDMLLSKIAFWMLPWGFAILFVLRRIF